MDNERVATSCVVSEVTTRRPRGNQIRFSTRRPRGNQIRFSGSQRGVRKIEFQAPCTYSCTYSIYRHTNHVESNLCGGISNLRGGTSNLRIFDINPATKFEYGENRILELGLAARPCETRRETRPRDLGLVSQAWSREKFETYF